MNSSPTTTATTRVWSATERANMARWFDNNGKDVSVEDYERVRPFMEGTERLAEALRRGDAVTTGTWLNDMLTTE